MALCLGIGIALPGCAALVASEVADTLFERRAVLCPEGPPPGKCPEWLPIERPGSLLESREDARVGAKELLACREWHEKRDAAIAACREEFGPPEGE